MFRQDKFGIVIISTLLLMHLFALLVNALFMVDALEATGTISPAEGEQVSLLSFSSPLSLGFMALLMSLLSLMDGEYYNVIPEKNDEQQKNVPKKMIKKLAIFWIVTVLVLYGLMFLYPSFWSIIKAKNAFSGWLDDKTIFGRLENIFWYSDGDKNFQIILTEYYTYVEGVFAVFLAWIWKTFLGMKRN